MVKKRVRNRKISKSSVSKRSISTNNRDLQLANLLSPKCRLNSLAFGYSLGILSAVLTLIMSLLAQFSFAFNIGMMQKYGMFVNFGFLGILFPVIGMGIYGFIVGYALAWLYNRFS